MRVSKLILGVFVGVTVPLGAAGGTPDAAPAVAASAQEDGGVDVSLTGSYRVSVQGMTDIRAYAAPEDPEHNFYTYDQDHFVAHRLRFEPVLKLHEAVSVTMDLQLATGFVAYDEPSLLESQGPGAGGEGAEASEAELPIDYGPPRGADGAAFGDEQRWADQLKLRKLFLAWRTPVGMVRIGRQASDWGLGVLANGGDNETQDWGSPRFGEDRNYGDVVDRLLVATAPFAGMSDEAWARRWILALGADIVVRDERISRADGDLGLQGIGALRYAHEGNELGLYIAHRDLRDHLNDWLKVWAYDLFGRGAWRFGDVEVSAVGELAWVLGETTWGRQSGADPANEVQQLGYVARLGAMYLPLGLGGDVELGYASGDSNPWDGYLRNFTFDPDFNPSLILFEELRAAESIASTTNAADPETSGIPQESIRFIPTHGSVTNAIYVRPTVRYHLEEMLEARVALLWARAEEDMVDPFGSKADAGGGPINFQGRACREANDCARDLGIEVDVGLDYTYQLEDWVAATVGVQGGRLWPGNAFRDSDGRTPDPINLVYGRLILRWLPPKKAS